MVPSVAYTEDATAHAEDAAAHIEPETTHIEDEKSHMEEVESHTEDGIECTKEIAGHTAPLHHAQMLKNLTWRMQNPKWRP